MMVIILLKIILDSRRRNKRRSKNDNEGRSHKCQTCGKAYLSYPALYTHIKTKHDMQGAGSGKGRGRPKKDIGVSVHILFICHSIIGEFYEASL
jgi:hypothetical protein